MAYVFQVALLACLLSVHAMAGPLAEKDVPEPLKPWVSWALNGHEDQACPFLAADSQNRLCVWPSRLELDLNDQSGRFRFEVHAFRDSRLELPGGADSWPQAVDLDDKPALVTENQGWPTVPLQAGAHILSGRFIWPRLPKGLPVPGSAGIVALRVNGKDVANPLFDDQGQIWIDAGQAPAEANEAAANRLDLQVFRKVEDGVPLRLTTRIHLDVAGRQRELNLSGAVPAGFIPLSLDSPLPARLEPSGQLRLQIRPGRWDIDVVTRQPGERVELNLAESLPEPWPQDEIWSFAAQPHLRVVEIGGVPAIDPLQTQLPAEWQSLPAYRVQAGETMRFKPIRRGDPEPAPDALNLRREFWLDFDGGGYTINDQIQGRMTRDWRLNVGAGMQLGRVAVDDQAQPITRLAESGPVGVELRRGELRLTADSRYEDDRSTLPATGWDKDFQSVGATLHLPPGWRLLAASGVDNAPTTWIASWTLLDLFLVLIGAVAVWKIWGWPAASIAALTLTLLWQESGAPQLVWLNLIAAIALLRVLPRGRPVFWVRLYRNLTLAALLLISVPFMIEQVRFGIFPQLAQPWINMGDDAAGRSRDAAISPMEAVPASAPAADEVAAPVAPPAPEAMRGLRKQFNDGVASSVASVAPRKARPDIGGAAKFREIDPDAITQTGPGLPRWQWVDVPLNWSGPVAAGQYIGLWLLSPPLTLFFNLLRVAMIIAFAFVLLRDSFPTRAPPATSTGGRFMRRGGNATGTVALLLVIVGSGTPPARADFPSAALLEQLASRLLAAPDCLPACAEVAALQLRFSATELQQRLEIHALEPVAVPLPAQAGEWLPQRVTVDGQAAVALARAPEGGLLLSLKPGHHEVVLAGALPSREQVQIPLPMRPHRVVAEGAGWVVTGIQDDAAPDGQLQLTRIAASNPRDADALESKPLPPFLEVTRTLALGLDWRVVTQVKRLSPDSAPVSLELPLLAGESPTTPDLLLKDGHLVVNLAGGEAGFQWESILERGAAIVLSAPRTDAWVEVWRLDASPTWHVTSEGIAVAHHQDGLGNWLPEWHPWPGESVKLTVSRPAGVPGATLTFDSSSIQVRPGQRATDVTLNLSARSAQGGQHPMRLPVGAVLQTASIDGQSQPLRLQERTVAVPIHPGSQSISLTWRQDDGIGGWFKTPRVDLGSVSVNHSLHVQLGEDRWVLLLGGPRFGPAVLFWSVLLAIVVIAPMLGCMPLTPLRRWEWGLLLIGLSQIEIAAAFIVVSWFIVLGWREKHAGGLRDSRFNVLQVVLGIMTLLALALLFHAVQAGLLGWPDMQVMGNNSTAYRLNWYQDRSANVLPRAWIVSAPLWFYRVLMLLWASWLAVSLVRWLGWAWRCYSAGGLWRQRAAPSKPAAGESKAGDKPLS